MLVRSSAPCAMLLVALATTSVACRTPRQAVRIGSSAAELKVKMEGLSPDDIGRSAWIYELSGCVAALNGTLKADEGIVSFRAPGLRRDLNGCQFTVRVATPPADVRAVPGAESGVLYLARDLLIRNSAEGELVATAPLQKLFERVQGDLRSSFTLKLKLEFPDEREAGPVTGALQCDPAIVGVGSYDGNSKSGEMRFLIGVNSQQAYRCEQIYINVGGRLQLYRSELATPMTFTASAGGETSLGPITLIKQQLASDPDQAATPAPNPAMDREPAPNPNDASGIEVNTLGTERCSDNEVFDTDKFACQPK